MSSLTTVAWLWRAALLLLLVGIGYLYGRGWSPFALAGQVPQRRPLILFLCGLGVIGVALISPVDTWAARYYSVRVVQHILLTGLAPLLLLLGDPYTVITAGMPEAVRRRLQVRPRVKRALVALTAPGLAWGLFVGTFWLWYDPALVAASRAHLWVHWLEVLTLLLTSCLYWWHIAAASPCWHPPMPGVVRAIYAFGGMLPIKIMGIVLLFGAETVVGGYVVHDSAELMVTLGNVSIADKSLGAMLIWLVGGAVYTYAATYLAGVWVGLEEAKPPLPLSILMQEETWKMPGLRK